MDSDSYSLLDAFGERLTTVAKWLAWFGGVILIAMALLTVVSIIGRALISIGLGPVKGDFELVATGCAIAVFSFLPWCQLERGHVSINILVDKKPPVLRRCLILTGDILIMVFAAVILWRLWLGFGEKFPYGSQGLRDALAFGYKPFSVEITYILGMPVWYGYFLCLFGAFFFLVTCFYTVCKSARRLFSGGER